MIRMEKQRVTRRAFSRTIAAALIAGAACERAAEPTPPAAGAVRTADGIEYTATTQLLGSYPVRIRATATATNTGAADVTLRFPDDCPLLLRAVTREYEPRWDQAGRAPCAGPPTEVRLARGESTTFESELTAQQVLGDSLPDMLYLLIARLRPVGQPPVELQAGRALLVTPRDAQHE
jgi:hypothetical protein